MKKLLKLNLGLFGAFGFIGMSSTKPPLPVISAPNTNAQVSRRAVYKENLLNSLDIDNFQQAHPEFVALNFSNGN